MHLIVTALRYLLSTALLASEGLWWLFHLGRRALAIATDTLASRHRLTQGGVRCPEGHSFSTEGTYTCSSCRFTYQGSIWRCANPECHAGTAFANCPTCRLSVRNPYRLG